MIKRIIKLLPALVILFSGGSALAISPQDLASLDGQSVYYDPSPAYCSSDGLGTVTTTGDAAWNSTVQAPYYLEEFAINVLEDLAQTTGTSQSSVLTQQHVIALVAWMWEEKGDLGNSDLFNPLNTNEQVDGATLQSTGDMAYPSFNAGVQATVLGMTGSLQSRVAAAFIDPTTTAVQVFDAIINYQDYPGNEAWATQDEDDQSEYTYIMMSVLQQTETDYASEATAEIGPGQSGTNFVSPSLLQYNPDSASSSSSTSTSTSADTSSGCSSSAVTCSNGSTGATTSDNTSSSNSSASTVQQSVVCIAEQQLAIWESQPGYPWTGTNSYSETGYLQYSQGRTEEWCADFVSWVFNQAGYPLAADPNWDLSAVIEVEAVGQEDQNFSFTDASNFVPSPGDIAIHLANGESHTNIVVAVNGQTITMIGGDQGDGPYPGGSIVSYEYSTTGAYGDNISGYVIPK